MLKKVNWMLNILMGTFVGVLIGDGIYEFWDAKAHPDVYAMQSAPWYTGVLLTGAVTAAVLAMAVVVKLIIRRKLKRQ